MIGAVMAIHGASESLTSRFDKIPNANSPNSGPYVKAASFKISPIMLGLSAHLNIIISSKNMPAKPRCTRWRMCLRLASLQSQRFCIDKISIQKLDVSAVIAPSALGNKAEINAMTKIICNIAGRCPSTTAGKILSPVAVTPTVGAYK